jgi:hypothetical protein
METFQRSFAVTIVPNKWWNTRKKSNLNVRPLSTMEPGQGKRELPADHTAFGARTASAESVSHSFIVKVWIEETAQEAGHVVWRGHITHVTTQERRYFQNLDEIARFIAPYLAQMGVRLPLRERIKESLSRWALNMRRVLN